MRYANCAICSGPIEEHADGSWASTLSGSKFCLGGNSTDRHRPSSVDLRDWSTCIGCGRPIILKHDGGKLWTAGSKGASLYFCTSPVAMDFHWPNLPPADLHDIDAVTKWLAS